MFELTLSPSVYYILDLLCGMVSLVYCVASALIVLWGFLLKRPVSLWRINSVAALGGLSTVLYLLLIRATDMRMSFWACLNLLCNLTFVLFFASRRKPRLAVWALYLQAAIYALFVYRAVTATLNVSILYSFVAFQLIPAVMLIGIGLIVLVQTWRERRGLHRESGSFYPTPEELAQGEQNTSDHSAK